MARKSIVRVVLGGVLGILAMLPSGCLDPAEQEPVESRGSSDPDEEIAGTQAADAERYGIEILYPFDETLFPPDIVAPTFRWKDHTPSSDTWLITFQFQDGESPMSFRSRTTEWTVSDETWETVKDRSLEKEAEVTIQGVNQVAPGKTLAASSVTISTSKDEVGAPLFFREVNLPFLTAVKDPAAHIRWRFGPISSKEPPPIVLEKLPVCGNCHSFSADGSTLAMEIDSGNDKGSFAIAPVEEHVVLDKSKIITWSDYRREDGDLTFGLLCQASPDGKHVVGTVKDRAIAVYRPDLAFSQLFFVVKGILAVYDRGAKAFHALPGADDAQYVQTNATWSPDGKSIVFARAEAYEPEGVDDIDSVLLPQESAREFLENGREFRYDLYRIPFNDGKGGTAEPIEGASHNGMSNYFAKFSPDGKWIVFCKAKSFMLLQPDSELYIIPAAGGEARRLRCNTSRMNSWHSWSPNGKWLVFSSKVFTVYTQLFLTHIDEHGNSTPPAVLSRFAEPERAANIPEFANMKPEAIRTIAAAFLDDHNYFRAATEFVKHGDSVGAIKPYRESLKLNPNNVASRFKLAAILMGQGQTEEAKAHFLEILGSQPDHAEAHHNLAVILYHERKLDEAAAHCRDALQIAPDFFNAHMSLGLILLDTRKLNGASEHLANAVRLKPDDPFANYYYGHVLHRQKKTKRAAALYRHAVENDPKLVSALLGLAAIHVMADQPELYDLAKAMTFAKKACEATDHKNPAALETLAAVHALSGQFGDAADRAAEALRIARAGRDKELANRLEQKLRLYQRGVLAR